MIAIFEELLRLRSGSCGEVDCKNHNRYRVVFDEKTGGKSAYYFSVPVYNIHTGRMIDMRFRRKEAGFHYVGSNASITVGDGIVMKNADGVCRISLGGNGTSGSERRLRVGEDRISPTANGVLLMLRCSPEGEAAFQLDGDEGFFDIRDGKTAFSLMNEGFRPLVTVSALGVFSAEGEHLSPAEICYTRTQDHGYRLTLKVEKAREVARERRCCFLVECNMYEPKLFQDVCVRSGQPKGNNTYGSSAFIGHTSLLGEEWLYSRMDYTKISELLGIPLKRIVLHLPWHGGTEGDLRVSEVPVRFCSFGSTWENKVSVREETLLSRQNDGYLSVDLTRLFLDPETGYMKQIHGLIFRPVQGAAEYSLISTADSHFAPQILEVHY